MPPPEDLGSARGSERGASRGSPLGSARGSDRLGSARLGSGRLGSARLGSPRLGSARLGPGLSSPARRAVRSLLSSEADRRGVTSTGIVSRRPRLSSEVRGESAGRARRASMEPASVRRSFARLGSARSVTVVPETLRATVSDGLVSSPPSSVRRSGEALSGSTKRVLGGV